MKSHMLRAVSVAAALLIPVGGLTILGAGVAGAKTLSTGSFATLTGVGKIKLTGVKANTTSTTTTAWTTSTGKTITATNHITANVTASQKKTATTTIKIKSGSQIVIIETGTPKPTNGCGILITVPVVLTKTGTTQWTGSVTPAATKIVEKTVTKCGSSPKTRIVGHPIKIKEI